MRTPGTASGPTITFDGAEHVVLRDIDVRPGVNAEALLVDGGSHVRVDRMRVMATDVTGAGGVRMSGATDVVVSRSTLLVRGCRRSTSSRTRWCPT